MSAPLNELRFCNPQQEEALRLTALTATAETPQRLQLQGASSILSDLNGDGGLDYVAYQENHDGSAAIIWYPAEQHQGVWSSSTTPQVLTQHFADQQGRCQKLKRGIEVRFQETSDVNGDGRMDLSLWIYVHGSALTRIYKSLAINQMNETLLP